MPSKNLHPYLIRLFFALIFIIVVSGSYLLFSKTPKSNNQQTVSTPTSTNLIQTTPSKTPDNLPKDEVVSPSPTDSPKEQSVTSSKPNISSSTQNLIPVSVLILDKNYSLQIKENSTVYDAMKLLSDQGSVSFVTKEFKGLGYFIQEMNGIKNDTSSGIYWFYYVNGKPAKIGISNFILKANDLITWKYEKSKF